MAPFPRMCLALTASPPFAQAKGNVDSTIGNIKDSVGGALGNNEMQVRFPGGGSNWTAAQTVICDKPYARC